MATATEPDWLLSMAEPVGAESAVEDTPDWLSSMAEPVADVAAPPALGMGDVRQRDQLDYESDVIAQHQADLDQSAAAQASLNRVQERNPLQNTLPYRVGETAFENIGGGGAGMVATGLGAAAELVGMEDTSEYFKGKARQIYGTMARRAGDAALVDATTPGDLPFSGEIRQGLASLAEAGLVIAGTGGAGAGWQAVAPLAGYFGAKQGAETYSETGDPTQALTSAVIESGWTMAGGALGGGLGRLAGVSPNVLGRAAGHLATKAKLPAWTGEALSGAAVEAMQEAGTEASHYLAEVGFGRSKWSKAELKRRMKAAAGPALVAGGLGGGFAAYVDSTADALDQRVKSATKEMPSAAKAVEAADVMPPDVKDMLAKLDEPPSRRKFAEITGEAKTDATFREVVVEEVKRQVFEGTGYRGTPAEARPDLGGEFYSPDKSVAEGYAGPQGNVKEKNLRFENPLRAENWVAAKKALGLESDKSMRDLLAAAKEAGHDGIVFANHNGKPEYVSLQSEEVKRQAEERKNQEESGTNGKETGTIPVVDTPSAEAPSAPFTLDPTPEPPPPAPVGESIPTTQPEMFPDMWRDSLPGQQGLFDGPENPPQAEPPPPEPTTQPPAEPLTLPKRQLRTLDAKVQKLREANELDNDALDHLDWLLANRPDHLQGVFDEAKVRADLHNDQIRKARVQFDTLFGKGEAQQRRKRKSRATIEDDAVAAGLEDRAEWAGEDITELLNAASKLDIGGDTATLLHQISAAGRGFLKNKTPEDFIGEVTEEAMAAASRAADPQYDDRSDWQFRFVGQDPEYRAQAQRIKENLDAAEGEPTSIKNEVVARERERRELPAAVEEAARGFGDVWDAAGREMAADPGVAEYLVEELITHPRAMTDREDAILLRAQVAAQNEYNRVAQDLVKAIDAEDHQTAAELSIAEAELSEKLLGIYNADKAGGRETGRGLNARKMMANADFSLAAMITRKRAAEGGRKLTTEERLEIAELHQKITDLESQLAKADTQAAEKHAQRAYAKLLEETAAWKAATDEKIATLEKEVARHKTIIEKQAKLETAVKRRNEIGAQLFKKLGNIGTASSTGFDPEILSLATEFVKASLEVGVRRFDLFIRDAAGQYGDDNVRKIRKELEHAWNTVAADVDGIKPATNAEEFLVGPKPTTREKQPLGPESTQSELSAEARNLAKEFIAKGKTDRDEVTDLVHQTLVNDYGLTDLTRRETMDAISLYGQSKELNKDPVAVKLREMSGELQQVAKLYDMLAGKAPAKTGMERQAPTDETRRLQKLVNEYKKKYNIVTTDPAKQLQSALGAVKTRLRNQISDLTQQIKKREKLIKTKTPLKYDAEAQKLVAERDALKVQFDEIFGKPGITDAQRIEMATKATERSIAELERRIKEGDFSASTKDSPTSPALEALRAKRDLLSAQFQELRALDPAYKAAQEAKRLQSAVDATKKKIADYERRIKEGDFSSKESNAPTSPLLEGLKKQQAILAKQYQELRAHDPVVKLTRDRAADAALQRSILQRMSRLSDRLVREDFDTAKKPERDKSWKSPLTRGLETSLDALKEQFNTKLREVRQERKLDEESKLLDEMLRTGVVPAKEPRKRAPLPQRLERKAFENKRKRQRIEAKLEREKPKTAFRRAVQWLNIPTTLKTMLDLSAVGVQNVFSTAAHPVAAVKFAGQSIEAFGITGRGERYVQALQKELDDRVLAPLWDKAGMVRTDPDGIISSREEGMASYIADRIPGVRASSRAFSTYSNLMRDHVATIMNQSVTGGKVPTLDQAKGIAYAANMFTGRGSIGRFDKGSELLQLVLWSPRMVYARFGTILGAPAYTRTPGIKLAVAKEYGRFLASAAVVYSLVGLTADEWERDPRSSNFMAFRYGQQWYNPFSGLASTFAFMTQVLGGQIKDRRTKKIYDHHALGLLTTPKYLYKWAQGDPTPLDYKNPYAEPDPIASFLRNKLGPWPGTFANIYYKTNPIGEPTTPRTVARDLTVPISVQGMKESMEELGMPQDVITMMVNILGIKTFGAGRWKGDRWIPDKFTQPPTPSAN